MFSIAPSLASQDVLFSPVITAHVILISVLFHVPFVFLGEIVR
jgi:K+-transporting ATPase A subunit